MNKEIKNKIKNKIVIIIKITFKWKLKNLGFFSLEKEKRGGEPSST